MSLTKIRTTPLVSGQTLDPFVGEAAERYLSQWKGYSYGMVRIQPGGMLMPAAFPGFHDRIMKYKFRPKDVVVITYPKCGTTWMQEIVWTMRNNPDLKNPLAAAPVNSRCPFLEMDSLLVSDNVPVPEPNHPLMLEFQKICPDGNPADGVFLQMAESISDPRTIKTHLPFSLLPEDMLTNSKVIYMMRNPKDLVVSFLHHCRLFLNHDYRGSAEDFVDNFVEGDMIYGQYDLHLKEAFDRRSNKNLLIVQYEELKADPIKEMKKLNQFLATGLTDDQIAKVSHYTSFAEMQKRDNIIGSSDEEGVLFNTKVAKADGGFFRKGEIGNWKEKLSPELCAKLDSWTKERLQDTDITFKYST